MTRARISCHFIALVLLGAASAGAAEDADGEKSPFRFFGGEQILIQVFGDGISETVTAQWQHQPQLVTTDGFVSVPAAGTVNIQGLSLQEATSAIVEKIKAVQKLKQPQVSITLLSLPSRQVYVGGEVAKPQALELPKDHRLNLASALDAAGGTTPDADLTRVQVNETQVDMSSAQSRKMPKGPLLSPGDVVMVPRAESFSVIGEVNKVGVFGRGDSRVPSGKQMHISDAIAAAGGAKPSADLRAVRLLRHEQSGEAKISVFDLEAAMNKGDVSQDPALEDGDKLTVPSNDGFIILGRVRIPGVYYAPGVGGTLMLSRLIALAGGFDTYAKKSSVIIVRKDKPGSTTTVDVKAILQEAKLDKDVPLNPGDMVFVGESSL